MRVIMNSPIWSTRSGMANPKLIGLVRLKNTNRSISNVISMKAAVVTYKRPNAGPIVR